MQRKIVQESRKKRNGISLGIEARGGTYAAIRSVPSSIKLRRALKGHFGKVTAVQWGGDSKLLISASQDGNVLIWNAASNHKLQVITLKSSYVMAACIEQTNGNLIACGGLDNLCTVYRRDEPTKPIEMAIHDGFISCCRFLSEKEILSSSGDSTIVRWDINRAMPLDTFTEHTADAMHIAIQPGSSNNVFMTCSVDKTCRLWDIRAPKTSVQTFVGYDTSDINSVEFMPCNGNVFATSSQDNTVRLFDIRTYNEINSFGTINNISFGPDGLPIDGYSSVAVSKSGRLIFAGHMNGTVHAYDTLSEKKNPVFTLSNAHERAVSDVAVSPHGDALCTAGWDGTVKIWA